jgi:hypothetical protein
LATPTPCPPAWSVVSSPAELGTFYGVAAVSPTDVWAVGDYNNGTTSQTLIEHWNGSAWSVVSSPNVGTRNNYITGLAVVSANDVWASGYFNNSLGTTRTLIEHWNGSVWSVVASSNAATEAY